ncbi:thioesterase-like superfamily-domain-containing protein [Hypomontagnella monticulosa]|nr:thioesterase-like superfamily-domain-containing protein [Hypomontagnella monticulosa]
MAEKSPIQLCVAVTESPESGPDSYVNERNLTSQEGVPMAFGGSLLGHSVAAAATTVLPGFYVYSLQAAFLKTADPKKKVIYRVERIADGRAYATRIVRATQGTSDKCFYVAIVALQNKNIPVGNVLQYGISAPDVGGMMPEHIPKEKLQEEITNSMTKDVPLLQLGVDQEPFDWRPLDRPRTTDPTHFRQRSFVRSPPVSSNDPNVHLAALAHLSDTYMLGVPLEANQASVGNKLQNVAMGASLNHNMTLHDPTARVDEWMLGDRDTFWGSDGRVVTHQRFWSIRSGRLVMSGSQDGLIRLKNAKL